MVQVEEKAKPRNRDRLRIVSTILTVAKEGYLKTHLMFRANLNHLMVSEYLEELLRLGLVQEEGAGSSKIYRTTAKGLKFIELYKTISGILEGREA
ncbi:MAG: hypothetical protein JRN52_05895 [Nitrososphaerota archaeon]|nr:hypothetical protein [Nitrososphaerota archaeon]